MIRIILLEGKQTKQNKNPHGSEQNENDFIKTGDHFLKKSVALDILRRIK